MNDEKKRKEREEKGKKKGKERKKIRRKDTKLRQGRNLSQGVKFSVQTDSRGSVPYASFGVRKTVVSFSINSTAEQVTAESVFTKRFHDLSSGSSLTSSNSALSSPPLGTVTDGSPHNRLNLPCVKESRIFLTEASKASSPKGRGKRP